MGELIRSRAPAENDNYTAVCVRMADEPDGDETTVNLSTPREATGNT